MARGLVLLGAAAGLWVMWVATGTGFLIGKSKLYPGGEVGWYFACTYLAARRTFEVNYSEAGRYRDGEATFFEKRRECPMLAHEGQSVPGWRYE